MTEMSGSDGGHESADARLRHEIKTRREAAKLSQARLGALIGYTRQYVSLAEREGHNLPSLELVTAIDDALGAGGALVLLRDAARRTRLRARTVSAPDQNRTVLPVADELSYDDDIVHVAIPRLRQALDALDMPDDGPVRPIATLRYEVERLNQHRLNARYVDIVRCVPDLLAELSRARQHGDERHRGEVASALTLALRAADGVAFKFRYFDLSSRIIDLMRGFAAVAEDPLLGAVAAYVRTETYFASGDLTTASRVLEQAIDQVRVHSRASAAALGALHMRAAVVAGRSMQADRARDHLAEAQRVAHGLREDVYHGTAFGPLSVRIHKLAVAAEVADATGIEHAAKWHPPDHLPAERRSHYYIDLARAQTLLGRPSEAFTCIQTAKSIAPQHTRGHPQVKQVLGNLLSTWRHADGRLLDLAVWAKVDRRR
ncbi:helix-turn-helix transcriptional regulator [Saccharothrix sp. NPDC042600]|uniref:helix-turn-helix transcriptional regulator n=1 Tax=Saccharothrix TaxID=2071 RepID=UPI0033C8880E|nr:hypothetical protein GCM10017745_67690 [Saccharothrix mutabilis subsp. capreolus]